MYKLPRLIHLFSENATPSQTSVNINPDVLASQRGNTIIDVLRNETISFREKLISTQIVENQKYKGA